MSHQLRILLNIPIFLRSAAIMQVIQNANFWHCVCENNAHSIRTNYQRIQPDCVLLCVNQLNDDMKETLCHIHKEIGNRLFLLYAQCTSISQFVAMALPEAQQLPCDARLLLDRIIGVSATHLPFSHDYAFGRSAAVALSNATTHILTEFHINPQMQGYYFLRSALQYIFCSSIQKPNMNRDIYPKLSAHYCSSPQRVEHSMRTALHHAYSLHNATDDTVYGKSPAKNRQAPSNREFLLNAHALLRQTLQEQGILEGMLLLLAPQTEDCR